MDKSLLGHQIYPFNFGAKLLELQAKDKEKRIKANAPPPVAAVFDQFQCSCSFEIEQICGYCKSLGLGRYGMQKEPEPKCTCVGCVNGYACTREERHEYDD